jgi:hypothetical protein
LGLPHHLTQKIGIIKSLIHLWRMNIVIFNWKIKKI